MLGLVAVLQPWSFMAATTLTEAQRLSHRPETHQQI